MRTVTLILEIPDAATLVADPDDGGPNLGNLQADVEQVLADHDDLVYDHEWRFAWRQVP